MVLTGLVWVLSGFVWFRLVLCGLILAVRVSSYLQFSSCVVLRCFLFCFVCFRELVWCIAVLCYVYVLGLRVCFSVRLFLAPLPAFFSCQAPSALCSLFLLLLPQCSILTCAVVRCGFCRVAWLLRVSCRSEMISPSHRFMVTSLGRARLWSSTSMSCSSSRESPALRIVRSSCGTCQSMTTHRLSSRHYQGHISVTSRAADKFRASPQHMMSDWSAGVHVQILRPFFFLGSTPVGLRVLTVSRLCKFVTCALQAFRVRGTVAHSLFHKAFIGRRFHICDRTDANETPPVPRWTPAQENVAHNSST